MPALTWLQIDVDPQIIAFIVFTFSGMLMFQVSPKKESCAEIIACAGILLPCS